MVHACCPVKFLNASKCFAAALLWVFGLRFTGGGSALPSWVRVFTGLCIAGCAGGRHSNRNSGSDGGQISLLRPGGNVANLFTPVINSVSVMSAVPFIQSLKQLPSTSPAADHL